LLLALLQGRQAALPQGGGREYFLPDFCYPIEIGDVLNFAKVAKHLPNAVLCDGKKDIFAYRNLNPNRNGGMWL
jgi:hypothetical protein